MNARVLADDNKREDYPLFDGLFAYFPAALCEVSRWSKVGNVKHNGPDSPLHWSREKSTDHQNKILRHLLDYDHTEENGFLEAVPLAWRALALLQTELEKRGWAEGRNGKWNNKVLMCDGESLRRESPARVAPCTCKGTYKCGTGGACGC